MNRTAQLWCFAVALAAALGAVLARADRIRQEQRREHEALLATRTPSTLPRTDNGLDARGILREQKCGDSGGEVGVGRGLLSQALHRLSRVGLEAPARRLVIVTSFCPCSRCCGRWADGITASGVSCADAMRRWGGFVAADKSIPFGTLVRVPGYARGRWVPVLDRGGAIRGDRLDVYCETHAVALRWGRQELVVEMRP